MPPLLNLRARVVRQGMKTCREASPRSVSTDRVVPYHQNDANGKLKRPRQLHRQLAFLCLIAAFLSLSLPLLHRMLSHSDLPPALARRSSGPDWEAVAALTSQMKEAKEDLQRLRSSVGLQKEALQRQKDALDKSRITSRRLELVTLKQMADLEAQISALQQPWTGHAGEAICVADMRCSRYIDAGDKSLAASSSVAACRSYCNRTYPAVPYFAFHNARGMVRMALAVLEPCPSSGHAW